MPHCCNWLVPLGLSLIVVALVIFGLGAHDSASYRSGMIAGYKLGASDGIEYAKTRIFEQNFTAGEISAESYDFFKTYVEMRFPLDICEIDPPYLTAKKLWRDLMRPISVVLMALGAVLTAWGCIRETVTGRKNWPEEGS